MAGASNGCRRESRAALLVLRISRVPKFKKNREGGLDMKGERGKSNFLFTESRGDQTDRDVGRGDGIFTMATSMFGSRRYKIRSLIMIGVLLMLAGVGGVVVALALKKPPPRGFDSGQNANDPAVRLWAAETLVGANSVSPAQDLVESVVCTGSAKGVKVASLSWDSASDTIKERGPLPILLTYQSLPPSILLDVFSWEGETLFLLAPASGGAVVLTESEFRTAPWKQAVWAEGDRPASRDVAVGEAKVEVDRRLAQFRRG
jgi:hypothetical protein